MKNIVIVGHGYWGKNLERVIQKNKMLFNLIGIIDIKYKTKKIKNIHYFNNFGDFLDSNLQVDCAVISTPATEHYKITKDALNNNINCLVEKPFVLDTKQATELFSLAKKKNKILMVENTFLYDNSII